MNMVIWKERWWWHGWRNNKWLVVWTYRYSKDAQISLYDDQRFFVLRISDTFSMSKGWNERPNLGSRDQDRSGLTSESPWVPWVQTKWMWIGLTGGGVIKRSEIDWVGSKATERTASVSRLIVICMYIYKWKMVLQKNVYDRANYLLNERM
jgi:hypothetical protein